LPLPLVTSRPFLSFPECLAMKKLFLFALIGVTLVVSGCVTIP
jgi:hypothetical protein